MVIKKEDTYHSFPDVISRRDIISMLEHYKKKGVNKFCIKYKGQYIHDLKVSFIVDKDIVEIELK